MLVSNNNLLNILLPNENKVLKDVLKEADAKTLNNMKTGNTTVGDILKDLFSDLKTGDKSKSTIENILKNSNLFKDLGNFTKSLDSLLSQIKDDASLAKYKPQLENFLKNISQIDNNSLKDLITKSGVFLEAKVSNQAQSNTTLPKNIESILGQIKTILNDVLKEMPKNMQALDVKKIETLIDKILQNNSNTGNNTNISNTNNTNDLKSLVSQLQNLAKNIGNTQVNNLNSLTSTLKEISNQSQLIDSKITNQNIQQNTQNSATQLNLSQTKELLNTNTQQILTQLKNELLTITNIPNNQNILKQIDALLQTNNQASLDIKNLLFTLKESITSLSSSQNSLLTQQNLIKVVEKFETLVNNFIQPPSTSSLNKENISQPLALQFNQQIEQKQNPLQSDMKSILLQIQEELLGKTDIKSADTLKQVDRMLMQVEYYQLLSITSNSNSVYIPFIWDMLDDGSISMKKLDEEKFYCEINLSLKEFGETQLLLSLYDKNKLDLTIYASKESFKQSIRENSLKLKQALNSVDLIPVNINIIDLKKDEDKVKEQQEDVYSQNINIGFGIDIKA